VNIRTKGGYPANSGTPGRLYTATNYSVLVQDNRGATVYTQLNSVDYLEAPVTTSVLKVDTIADLRLLIPTEANVQASVGGSVTVGDGLIGPFYYWDPLSSATDDGFTVVQPTAATGFGRWLIVTSANIPTETVNLTVADTGDTLSLGLINKIYLVDTDGGATTLTVPDGDFIGQNVTLSNDGSNTLTINGTGIITDFSVTEAVLLTCLGSTWGVTFIGSISFVDLEVSNDLTVGNEIITKDIEITGETLAVDIVANTINTDNIALKYKVFSATMPNGVSQVAIVHDLDADKIRGVMIGYNPVSVIGITHYIIRPAQITLGLTSTTIVGTDTYYVTLAYIE